MEGKKCEVGKRAGDAVRFLVFPLQRKALSER